MNQKPSKATILQAYRRAVKASYGDSNDREIEAWKDVASLAIDRLGFDTRAIEEAVEAEQ
jgi:hypothetical protein